MKNTGSQKFLPLMKDRISRLRMPKKLIFMTTGLLASLWFLIRVIPKPSRATYPCMRASAPLASAFVIYLLSISGSAFFFKRALKAVKSRKLATTLALLLAVLVFAGISMLTNTHKTRAAIVSLEDLNLVSNQPVGVAKGYKPGRVVWVHDTNATNANININNGSWKDPANADQHIIDTMLQEGIMQLADTTDIEAAWDRLIRYFNEQKHGENRGYTPGEKFIIKLNFTNASTDLEYGRMNSTPQVAHAILHQLVDVLHVNEEDITMGDPFRGFEYCIGFLNTDFPDVNYIARDNTLAAEGVTQTDTLSSTQIFFSDGVNTALLPVAYVEADYLINIPCLKSHESAGITLCAKNHQGSVILPGDPIESQSMYPELHHSFPTSTGQEGFGKYRHLVDYAGHEYIGGNTLLNIIDGIWGGHNWQGYLYKWQMDPFNNDFPNSLFLSQDQVAIDAVGFDILAYEFDNLPADDPRKGEEFPLYEGTHDFLLQEADPTNWPVAITYDPENDGTPLTSLGVYEHWNDAINRQYSRNLGTGNGIELIYITDYTPPEPNTPPVAHAGDDISITLPTSSTTLNGSGSDANGNSLSYSWAQVDGPNAATIEDADSATTGISGLIEGLYEFELTVNDGEDKDTDSVTVTVNPEPNIPPVAHAGDDISITLPTSSTTLNGSGSDADSDSLTFSWAQLSGPNAATIADAGSAATGINGLIEGLYVFGLTVDDGEDTDSDSVTVTVNALQTNISTSEPISEIAVYPNPSAEGFIKIDIGPSDYIQEVLLFTITGQMLLRIKNQNSLDVSQLTKGQYLIKVKTNLGTYNHHIIIH